MASQVALVVNNLPANAGNVRNVSLIPGSRRKWQPTPVFLPTDSPWTEETGGLQSIGSKRVRQEWRLSMRAWGEDTVRDHELSLGNFRGRGKRREVDG